MSNPFRIKPDKQENKKCHILKSPTIRQLTTLKVNNQMHAAFNDSSHIMSFNGLPCLFLSSFSFQNGNSRSGFEMLRLSEQSSVPLDTWNKPNDLLLCVFAILMFLTQGFFKINYEAKNKKRMLTFSKSWTNFLLFLGIYLPLFS